MFSTAVPIISVWIDLTADGLDEKLLLRGDGLRST